MFYVIYCRWSRVRNRTDNRLNYFHVFRLFCLLLFPPFLISLFTRSIVFVLNCSLCFNVFIVLFVWIFCFSDFQNIYINLTPKKIANKTKKKTKNCRYCTENTFLIVNERHQEQNKISENNELSKQNNNKIHQKSVELTLFIYSQEMNTFSIEWGSVVEWKWLSLCCSFLFFFSFRSSVQRDRHRITLCFHWMYVLNVIYFYVFFVSVYVPVCVCL